MAFDGIYEGRQVEDLNGVAVSGAKIYFYKAGTLTLQTAYTDAALTTPAANPVIADSAGYYDAYLKPGLSYDIVVKSADDAITYAAYSRANETEAADANIGVQSLSDLKALTSSAVNDTARMQYRTNFAAGGGGDFVRLGDQSATMVLGTAAVSAVNTGNGQLTATAHGFWNGHAVVASAADAGLTALTQLYWVRRVDANTVTLHPSFHDALNNTNTVTLTALTGSLSLKALLDPGQGFYVIADGDPLDGSSGAWVRLDRHIHESMFGVLRDGSTEDHAAMQHAIYYAWAINGSIVHCGEGTLVLGDSLYIPQGVWLSGEGAGYVNLYSSTDFAVSGTAFEAKTGLNKDLIIARYFSRIDEAVPSAPDDARHQGGLKGLVVHGKKDTNFAPSSNSLNSTGSGVKIEGVSNFGLDEVLAVRCAESGIEIASYDYGGGTISSNNMQWGDTQSLGNKDKGYLLSGGDQQFGPMTAGYNGDQGILTSAETSSFSDVFCWDNVLEGFYNTADDCTVSIITSYDNGYNGVYNSGERFLLDSYRIARNGQEGTATAAQKAGILLATGSLDFTIGDGQIFDDAKFGPAAQNYPIYSSSGANTGIIGNYRASGHVTSNFPFGLTYSNVQLHSNLSTNQALHPGFVAQGEIDLNGNNLDNVGWLGLGADGAATYASSVLTLGAARSNYSTAADNTVTDFAAAGSAPQYAVVLLRNGTSANSLTFTHNNSKIRCPDGVNYVLGPYEAVWLESLNTGNTIWQVVGTAV